MNDALEVDPRTTAVITIDCHRGHLDPAIATMPVAPGDARSVTHCIARLLRFARERAMPVIHVILTNRVLPDGVVEPMHNPFWRTVEAVNQQLTPERVSTISGHNLLGSPQTELMPELGPDPSDLVLTTKRRLSVYRDTDLDVTLRQLRIDTVVLVGINTNTCVQCAAFESLNRDLKTIVIADGVHSMYGDDLHAFALQNIARCLGWVLSLEQLIGKVESRQPNAVSP
jgi:nicotinamidase-related amidase